MTIDADGPVRGPFAVVRPRDVAPEARPGAGECAVLRTGTHLRPLPRGEVPTSGMNWFRAREDYWIVDLREHTTTLDVELDSADRGLRFQGSVDVVWRIGDARAAAEHGPVDVRRLLERRLLRKLTAEARRYELEEIAEFESWIDRELSTASMAGTVLEVLEVSCVLRPDGEVTDITRTGRLSQLKRTNARDILDGGEIGLMAEALVRDPDSVVEFLRTHREDKRAAVAAHLEVVKAVHTAGGSEEHERVAAIDQLVERLGGAMPGARAELPGPPLSPIQQLANGRPRRRDRRASRREDGQPLDNEGGTKDPAP
ncbi:hypothetical protein [Streptomyces sp. NPDC101178]|uniref:hypothetical protein n=1 Tax=Streptomyces sp. NPDC101178 TaxID=3366124 RepID=UPI00380B22A8